MQRHAAKSILRESLSAWFFILPALLFLLLFMVYPILHTFFLSFQKYNFIYDKKPAFVGFSNYMEIFKSVEFLKAIRNTLYFALVYIPSVFLLGFVVGLLFSQDHLFSARVSKVVFFVPMVVPVSLSCIMFLFILNPQWGLLNSFLKDRLGTPSLAADWMNNPSTALNVILFVTLWQTIGFIGLLFMAGIQSIPDPIIEASIIDGATAWKRITAIILPNLRPTYQIVGILATVTSIKLFAQVISMTAVVSPVSAGGPANATLTMYVATYKVAFGNFNMGAGSAMGYFISATIIVLFALNFLINRVKRE